MDEKTICDLECIFGGHFHPLSTFMGEADWRSVCSTMHLANGKFFPLPVTLAVCENTIKVGDVIRLTDATHYTLATMQVAEVFKPDIDWECQEAYGTADTNHPYVGYKQGHKAMVYVTGSMTQVNPIRHYDFMENRIKPADTRAYFESKGWKTVVGFQTRNPMHRAHYELTQYALQQTGAADAKLFLNPVVGETQVVDIDYHVRVHCYRKMLPKYPNDSVLMGLLPLAMRMAGPREACLHALIRKNYGCTHFVVGRDHAGPSFKKENGEPFYGPYDAQNLFFKHSKEIGIEPIVSKMIVYNATKETYQAIDTVPEGDEILKLSGTEVRKRLRSGEEIPGWFSYPEIVDILRKGNKKRGTCYYFIGLPAAGKTTYANMLKSRLLEADVGMEVTILDGDIVRTNLSKGLGFSREDRSTNVRRIGFVASEIVKHGGTVICANIAPYEEDRLANRGLIESLGGRYVEIWVNTPLEVCETRDVKGLYKLAREGKIKEFTGISDPFEEPTLCDIRTWENNGCLEVGNLGV